jgi:hypothetical protein
MTEDAPDGEDPPERTGASPAREEGDGDGDESPAASGDEAGATPPDAVIDEAERLTRLARDAVDEAEAAAYREAREDALAAYDYTARLREADERTVLVCHPADWLEEGVVRTDRIADVSRGIERQVAGAAPSADWDVVAAHNRDLADAVAAAQGDVHGANAHALADYASNHLAKRIEDLGRAELRKFLTEYFPRNAFPTDDQRARVEESLRLVARVADADLSVEE